jgi:hypothetical protein
MQASKMEWDKKVVPQLSPEEWPMGVLDDMDERVILAMSELRKITGAPMWPSPVTRAHVRASGNSMHSTQEGTRLSKATDFFIRWHDFLNVYTQALRHPEIGGVGFYNAMKFRSEEPGDWCMVHIDLREDPLHWMGNGREPVNYVYWDSRPVKYTEILLEMLQK